MCVGEAFFCPISAEIGRGAKVYDRGLRLPKVRRDDATIALVACLATHGRSRAARRTVPNPTE
jgi:hypothetical protein